METQENVKSTVQVESATSQFPTVVVERILEPRSDKPFRGVMMRWVTKRSGNTNILSQFLGGSFKENRVVIQTMADEIIESLGLKVGDNINEVFKAKGFEPIRVSISEITEEEYLNLEDNEQAGYTAKVNPSTGEVIAKGGKSIYRRVFVDSVDGSDDYIQSDGTQVKLEDSNDLPV